MRSHAFPNSPSAVRALAAASLTGKHGSSHRRRSRISYTFSSLEPFNTCLAPEDNRQVKLSNLYKN